MATQGYGEYDTEAAEIDRRRQYAELIRQQGMAPLEQRTVGGVAIRNSPLEGLARGLQMYAGQRGVEQAGSDRRALAGRMEGERSTELAAMVNALRGTPARPQQMGADDMAMIADQGGQSNPMTQAIPGDPNAAAMAAMGSKFGDIRGMAPGLMNIAETRQNRSEDRAFRGEQADAQRQFQMEQLKMRAEDARLSQQERIAAQQQLAQMQMQGRQDMVQLAASMRPAPQPQPAQIVQTDSGIYERNRDGTLKQLTDPATGKPLQPKPSGNAKGKTDVESTMDVYTQASNGLIDGLKGTETGPIAGRIPAMTTAQQTAQGAEAAMAPVLKQIFRIAGEGTFTDKDQDLLMKMVPTRKDTPTAAQNKIDNIDNIVSAKLGIPPPDRPWRDKTKVIATPNRRTSDAEPPPGAVRRIP